MLCTYRPPTILGDFDRIAEKSPKSSGDNLYRACESKDQTLKRIRTLHSPHLRPKNAEKNDRSYRIWRLEPLKQALWAPHDVAISSQICGWKLQRVCHNRWQSRHWEFTQTSRVGLRSVQPGRFCTQTPALIHYKVQECSLGGPAPKLLKSPWNSTWEEKLVSGIGGQRSSKKSLAVPEHSRLALVNVWSCEVAWHEREEGRETNFASIMWL